MWVCACVYNSFYLKFVSPRVIQCNWQWHGWPGAQHQVACLQITSEMCYMWVCIVLWLFPFILAEYVLGNKTSNFRNISGKEFVWHVGWVTSPVCHRKCGHYSLVAVKKHPKSNLTRFRCVALISLNQNTKIVWYFIPVTSV